VWLGALLSGSVPHAAAPQASPGRAASAQTAGTPVDNAAVLKQYCVTCHNQRLKTGGLALDAPDLGDVAAHADVWEKVLRKVRAGMMPPAGVPRPDATVQRALVASLERTLDDAARRTPNPAARSFTG
jgi:mono/diheme cytochrome c family protein